MNSGGGGLLNQSTKMSHSPQVQQMMNHHHQQQLQQQMHMHPQQSHHLGQLQPHMQQQQHHHMHQLGTNNAAGLSNNSLGMNHLSGAGQQQPGNQQQQPALSNYSMNSLAATGQPLQMAAIQGGLYDHQQHQGMNGMTGQMQNPMATAGTAKLNEHMVYLGAGQPHLNVIPPQNQYMTPPMNRSSMGVSTRTFDG